MTPDGAVQVPNPRNRGSSSDEENRKFKVVIKLVAEIDLQAVMDYCQSAKSPAASKDGAFIEERSLTGEHARHRGILDAD